jgi:hypothetical protein
MDVKVSPGATKPALPIEKMVGQIVLQDQATSAVIAVALLLLFGGLWFGFPLVMRNRMSGG